MSKIGSLDPEILAKKWSKSGQIEVSERFFEKISRNMTDTEKMMLTNIIGNSVADNIVFEVSKIGSLDPEILAKKWSKSGQIEVSVRFFEKISRNMTNTEKMLISIVVGNRIVRI